ncbi:hypothetical protein FHR34_001648 [Kitasatospora kifunensis]|uniref:Uncharacterized protein n=1 Tax=Kitasatospora kifunensis TaxID=58351 RepID=A0A7W7QZX1_KITKI|nr:hypothetical protein [Kitasatospora kifunensis]
MRARFMRYPPGGAVVACARCPIEAGSPYQEKAIALE